MIWEKTVFFGDAKSVHNGATMDVNTSNGFIYYAKSFNNALGILVNVKVSQATGLVMCGIEQELGTSASGDLIVARVIMTQLSDGRRSIEYMIIETPISGTPQKHIASGVLGGIDESWSVEKEVAIGLALVDQEIWFYTSECDILLKAQPFVQMGPPISSDIYIFAGQGEIGSTGNFSGTISNAYVAYP